MDVLPDELCCVWQEASGLQIKTRRVNCLFAWSFGKVTEKREEHLLNRDQGLLKKNLPFPARPFVLRKEVEGHNSSMKPSNNLLISIIKSLDWNKRLSTLLSHIILPKFLFSIPTVVRWKPPVFILITKSTFPLYQFTASLLNAVHLISYFGCCSFRATKTVVSGRSWKQMIMFLTSFQGITLGSLFRWDSE